MASVGSAVGTLFGVTMGCGLPATTGGGGVGSLGTGFGAGSGSDGGVTGSVISNVLISSTVSGDSNCFSLSSLGVSFGI